MTESLQQIIRRDSWYGIKPMIASVLKLPLVNGSLHRLGSVVLPPAARHRLPVRATRSFYQLENGQRVILLGPDRDQVAKDMFWGSGAPVSARDRHVLHALERLSADAELFLDIGTYSGLFALIAVKANPKIRAIAFDVLPENYLATLANFIENDVLSEAEARLCGLGEREAEVLMPRVVHAASRPTSMSLSAEYSEGVRVPVIPLDSLSLQRPMLWKIDVEGFEWDVLRGARRTVSEVRPDMICEILPDFAHAGAIEGFLRPLGYRFFISTNAGLAERSALVPDDAGRDWLFVAREAAVAMLQAMSATEQV